MKKTRINKEVKFRHRFWFSFLKLIFWPFARLKYHYHAKKNKIKKGGPYLILCNHTVALDPAFIGLAFNFPIYFVASDQLFNLGFLTRLLRYIFNPISKTKSLSDIGTIKKMKKIVNEGGNVCIMPEGNLTYNGATSPLSLNIAKLVKFLNVPVIFYRIKGFYLSNPRWGVTRRYGKTSGGISKIITPDEYNDLSQEDLWEL
ncbi:MAG: lysophospholipid acyltransferase family protein, partial [Bacilli bacterium]|nr:lysophospholipid acyltransferase family protein [Bacilli bacterium]